MGHLEKTIQITFKEASEDEVLEEDLIPTWILPEGKIYEGNWPDGDGKMFLANGDTVEGHFTNGKFEKSRKRKTNSDISDTSSVKKRK